LKFWQCCNLQSGFDLGGEGKETGVECTAKGRGDEMCDPGVVGEILGEGRALLLPERREVGVVQGVVCFIEVVVALGVADAVDCCFSHVGFVGRWVGFDD